jgi:hypothetical protein
VQNYILSGGQEEEKMGKKIFGLIIVLLLCGSNLYAADGDLIVNGKLGIGTINPPVSFSVGSGNPFQVNTAGLLNITSSLAGPLIYVKEAGTGYGSTIAAIVADTDNPNGSSNYSFQGRVQGSNTFSVRSDGQGYFAGNVGIGTTTPNNKLTIGTPLVGAVFGSPISSNAGSLPSATGSGLKLADLGFNTSNPGNAVSLGFYANRLSTGADWTTTAVGMGMDVDNIFGVNGSSLWFHNNGNVGIGIMPISGYKLYVAGTGYATAQWLSSDMKFKENIAPIESALDKVLNINGVTFNWNSKEYKDKGFPEGKHYGVIAQDIETVLPEIVKTVKVKVKDTDEEEDEKAVAYSEIIPVLIEAIKEQQQQIANLEADVQALKTKK